MSTINTVSPSEINECSLELENIFSSLTSEYDDIKDSLLKYNSTLNEIKSYDNTYTRNPEKIQEKLGPFMLSNKYSVTIRNISISGDIINNVVNEFNNSSVSDSINLVKEKSNDLQDLSSSICFYISIIEKQLSVEYNGDLVNFFNSIKKNPDWIKMKENNENSMLLKQNDEIYKLFHSKNLDDYDYVDYALDHIGLGFLPVSYSSFAASWYKGANLDESSIVSLDDDWCAEYVTYVMFNYNKNGNDVKIPSSYISCAVGAEKLKKSAKKLGIGEWHDSNEEYQPKRGDIFFHKNEGRNGGHTGIVVASDDKYVYTIEGNTPNDDGIYFAKNALEGDPDSYNKGGYVNTRIRSKEYINVGYYTPDNSDLISDKKINYSRNVNVSNKYRQLKIDINDKYEIHQAETGHTDRGARGL